MYIIKGDERVNKILIAEDEAAIANLVRTVLTDAGYRCVWAPDGIQAADLLEQEPFDLALLTSCSPEQTDTSCWTTAKLWTFP